MRTGAGLGAWLFFRGDTLTGVAPRFANRPYGLAILNGARFAAEAGSLRRGFYPGWFRRPPSSGTRAPSRPESTPGRGGFGVAAIEPRAHLPAFAEPGDEIPGSILRGCALPGGPPSGSYRSRFFSRLEPLPSRSGSTFCRRRRTHLPAFAVRADSGDSGMMRIPVASLADMEFPKNSINSAKIR